MNKGTKDILHILYILLSLLLYTYQTYAQTGDSSARQGGVELCQVQLFPDVAMNEVRVEAVARVPKAGKYTLTCQRSCYPDEDSDLATLIVPLRLQKGENTVSVLLDMGENPHLWSEFHPDLYQLHLTLANKKLRDEQQQTFAMRNITKEGAQWVVNGNWVFLRGVCEQEQPLPSKVEDWRLLFSSLKQNGLNFYRFPSQQPTAEALVAADEVGVYVSAEEGMFTDNPQTLHYQEIPQYAGVLFPEILDVTTDSMRLPEAIRAWSQAVVPIAEMEKDSWTACDTLRADLAISNYTEDDYRQPLVWQVYSVDEAGHRKDLFHQAGEVDYVDAWQGEVTKVGEIALPLSDLKTPTSLCLELTTGAFLNRYSLRVDVAAPRNPSELNKTK